MAHFSDLPLELITHILYKTSPSDLLACKRINKFFYNFIQNSILLQYHLALDDAQAKNNPYSSLPSSERLKALKDSESAWAFLRPKLTAKIPVPHNPSGIYDLTGGVYLLGNANRTQLHYLKLPSSGKDAVYWEVINVGRTIIDMGLCIYEHDLIAIITTTPRLDTPRTFDIELSILKFSTGQPHPEAREPKIHVLNVQWEKPAIGIEIVGDHLVLVLYYLNNAFTPEDHVFIWEWRTGVLKTHFTAPYRTYSGLIFLNEHLILLPNTQKNSLDIFRIPSTSSSTPTTSTPLLSLLLPALANGRAPGGISCRAEPNPISQSSLRSYFEKKQKTGEDEDDALKPTRGFLVDAEEAICIFTVRVLGVQLGHFQFGHTFTFIVHRHALVNIVDEFEREQQREALVNSQMSETPTIDLEQVDGIANVKHRAPAAPVRGNTDEQTAVPNPAPAPTPTKPYRCWGPTITRWFNADGIPTRWITTTSGQRYVLIADAEPESALGPGYPYVVLDFGKVAVKRMQAWTEAINERVARMARRGETAVEEPHDDRLEGVLGAEEDEGTLGFVDLEGDEWDLEHLYSDDSEEGSDNMSLEHGDSPIGSDSEAEVDGEAEQIGVAQDSAPSADVEMELNSTSCISETQREASEFPNSLDEDVSIETLNLSKRIWCMTKPNVLEPADTFAEPVLGSLPYVACASERPHPFHGVLLDEERIVGLRTDMLDRIKEVEVHYFG